MFIPVIPLYTSTLLGAFTTTSYTLFSSHAGTNMGIIPLLNQRYEPFPIGPELKVKAWNSYFSRAMVCAYVHVSTYLTSLFDILIIQFYGIGSSLVSAGTSFVTAYIHPDPQVRTLSLISGLSSLLVGPITFGVGLPAINSELIALGKESNVGSDEWNKRASRVDELVQGWEKRHNIRYISYLGGWAFSAAALLSALSR